MSITMIINISGNKQPINSVEDWFNAAPPKGEKTQWKVGRSALEMARFAVSDDFPHFISKICKWAGINDESFNCEPEAKTSFDKGMGTSGPRNHDLLMIGESSVIGIEAKVSESFDKQIKVKKVNASENMHTRLDACKNYLFGDKDINVDEMYYQLFSATIGTILEAKRNEKTKAVALFLTFTGNVSKEPEYGENVKINNHAFELFCSELGLGPEGGKLKNVPGLNGKPIECYVKKVNVEIAYNYEYE